MLVYSFPPELWFIVLEQADQDLLITSLSVCQFLHRINLPRLFRHISLRYGTPWHGTRAMTKRDVEIHVRQIYRNEGILRHIASDATFARAVQQLSFCWFERAYSFGLYYRHTG